MGRGGTPAFQRGVDEADDRESLSSTTQEILAAIRVADSDP